MGDEYEERVLRIMVQDELSPITERTAAVDVVQSLKIHRRSSLAVLQAKMCHPPTGNDQPID
jgi:hypothetical protein